MDLVYAPMGKIEKKCLCCGKVMELDITEDRDFCDRCFIIVCREVFNKANGKMGYEKFLRR